MTAANLLNGRDVTDLPTQKRGVGFVFQNYSLFQHMTVAQNIAFGLEIRHMPRASVTARVSELLDLIGMADYGDRMPSQLSGGQQQRVALARALAPEPEVLLLDEPFGALDVKIRAQLRQNLREIQQRLGITAILVTHDQDEAFELADRIGIIEAGELLEVGKPETCTAARRIASRRPFWARRICCAGSATARASMWASVICPRRRYRPSFRAGVDMMLRPESVEICATPPT